MGRGVQVSFTVPIKIYEAIKKRAEANGMTISAYLRHLVTLEVKQMQGAQK